MSFVSICCLGSKLKRIYLETDYSRYDIPLTKRNLEMIRDLRNKWGHYEFDATDTYALCDLITRFLGYFNGKYYEQYKKDFDQSWDKAFLYLKNYFEIKERLSILN
jgi:hypothetical protein